MSLSKHYPYTFREKINYYFGKCFCYGAIMVGASIYARFLWKQPYLSLKDMGQKTRDELIEQIEISSNKRRWHSKSLLLNSFIIMPTIASTHYYQYTNVNQLIYLSTGAFALFINNIYGIIAHTYNSIRLQNYCHLIKYGTIEENIDKELEREKCTWLMVKRNGRDPVYIIYNAYYQNLYFFFQFETTANNFLSLLTNLSSENVDYLNDNSAIVRQMQRKFTNEQLDCWLKLKD